MIAENMNEAIFVNKDFHREALKNPSHVITDSVCFEKPLSSPSRRQIHSSSGQSG